jgi:enterochelin esterase family protein
VARWSLKNQFPDYELRIMVLGTQLRSVMKLKRNIIRILATVMFGAIGLSTSFAQSSATTTSTNRASARVRIISPEVSADRKITFRIAATNATSVKLGAGDIQGLSADATRMSKGPSGVWEVTVGPVPAGAYRYNFNVDGLSVLDPRNPGGSESNDNMWSLVVVPGAEFMDTKDVPHGAVAEVVYQSSTLKRARRMHVYTPPGYENGRKTYPVFYLLHGSSDSDDSWSSVGRAGFIMDNLIAAKKAKPMIVVMPAGHTGSTGGGRSGSDFERDFVNDIMPQIEKRYRVQADRRSRAMAGLSMGGGQTLNIGFANLDKFAYLGVFSSGVFGIAGGGRAPATNQPAWEVRYKDSLDNAQLKKGLKLVWFATGKNDFLLKTSQATVEMLKKHGFNVAFKGSEGGHTWLNWRDYLIEFAPLLFNESRGTSSR